MAPNYRDYLIAQGVLKAAQQQAATPPSPGLGMGMPQPAYAGIMAPRRQVMTDQRRLTAPPVAPQMRPGMAPSNPSATAPIPYTRWGDTIGSVNARPPVAQPAPVQPQVPQVQDIRRFEMNTQLPSGTMAPPEMPAPTEAEMTAADQAVYQAFQAMQANPSDPALRDAYDVAVKTQQDLRLRANGPSYFTGKSTTDLLDAPRDLIVTEMGANAYDVATGKKTDWGAEWAAVAPGNWMIPGIDQTRFTQDFETWVEDPQNWQAIRYAAENGFQADENSPRFTGGRAVWELFINSAGTGYKVAADILLDPSILAAPVQQVGKGFTRLSAQAAADARPMAATIYRGAGRGLSLPQDVLDVTVDAPFNAVGNALGSTVRFVDGKLRPGKTGILDESLYDQGVEVANTVDRTLDAYEGTRPRTEPDAPEAGPMPPPDGPDAPPTPGEYSIVKSGPLERTIVAPDGTTVYGVRTLERQNIWNENQVRAEVEEMNRILRREKAAADGFAVPKEDQGWMDPYARSYDEAGRTDDELWFGRDIADMQQYPENQPFAKAFIEDYYDGGKAVEYRQLVEELSAAGPDGNIPEKALARVTHFAEDVLPSWKQANERAAAAGGNQIPEPTYVFKAGDQLDPRVQQWVNGDSKVSPNLANVIEHAVYGNLDDSTLARRYLRSIKNTVGELPTKDLANRLSTMRQNMGLLLSNNPEAVRARNRLAAQMNPDPAAIQEVAPVPPAAQVVDAPVTVETVADTPGSVIPQPTASPLPETAERVIDRASTGSYYRETSLDELEQYLPVSRILNDTLNNRDVYLADSVDLALGQGSNRGVLLEFDQSAIKASPRRSKPGLAMTGQSEYVARAEGKTFQDALRSITIDPRAPTDRAIRERMRLLLADLEQLGWIRSENVDGSVSYQRPGTTPSVIIPEPNVTPQGRTKTPVSQWNDQVDDTEAMRLINQPKTNWRTSTGNAIKPGQARSVWVEARNVPRGSNLDKVKIQWVQGKDGDIWRVGKASEPKVYETMASLQDAIALADEMVNLIRKGMVNPDKKTLQAVAEVVGQVRREDVRARFAAQGQTRRPAFLGEPGTPASTSTPETRATFGESVVSRPVRDKTRPAAVGMVERTITSGIDGSTARMTVFIESPWAKGSPKPKAKDAIWSVREFKPGKYQVGKNQYGGRDPGQWFNWGSDLSYEDAVALANRLLDNRAAKWRDVGIRDINQQVDEIIGLNANDPNPYRTFQEIADEYNSPGQVALREEAAQRAKTLEQQKLDDHWAKDAQDMAWIGKDGPLEDAEKETVRRESLRLRDQGMSHPMVMDRMRELGASFSRGENGLGIVEQNTRRLMNMDNPNLREEFGMVDGPGDTARISAGDNSHVGLAHEIGKLTTEDYQYLNQIVDYNGKPMRLWEAYEAALHDFGANYQEDVAKRKARELMAEQLTPENIKQAMAERRMTAAERKAANAQKSNTRRVAGAALRAYDAWTNFYRQRIMFNWARGAAGILADQIERTYNLGLNREGRAALQAWNPKTLRRFLNDERGKQAAIEAIESYQRYQAITGKKPPADWLQMVETRFMEGGNKNVAGEGLGKFYTMTPLRATADPLIRDFRVAADRHARYQLGMAAFDRNITDAHLRMRGLVRTMAERNGISGDEAVDSFDAFAKGNGGTYNGEDVSTWATELGLERGKATRLGRDWAEMANKASREADARVRKLLFSYKMTNADNILRRGMLFHYWISRAAVLHARTTLQNPWLLNGYIRGYEAMQREAEENGYPPNIIGFTKLMQSELGMYGLVSPANVLVPFFFLMEGAASENQDPGVLGFIRRWGGFINPQIEMAAAILGFHDRAPDITGTTAIRRAARVTINWLNNNGHAGLVPDAFGEEGTWQASWFDQFLPWAAEKANQGIRAITGGENSPLGEFVATDPGSYEQDVLTSIMVDMAEADWGPMDGWTEEQWDEFHVAQTAVLTGSKGNDLSAQAIDAYSDERLIGVGITAGMPGGIIQRYAPRDQDLINSRAGYEALDAGTEPTPEQQAAMDTRRVVTAGSPEDAALDMADERYREIGTPRQQSLSEGWTGIVYNLDKAPPGSVVSVGGRIYEVGAVKAMSESERMALADAWVAENDGTDELASYRAERKQFLVDNPEYGAFDGWRDTARDYEGGIRQFRIDRAAANPNFRRAVSEKEAQLRKDGTDAKLIPTELDNWSLSLAAYKAAQGIKDNAYDPDPMSTGDQATVNSILRAGNGGSGGGSSSPKQAATTTAQKITKELREYEAEAKLFDQVLAGYGIEGGFGAINNPLMRRALEGQFGDLMPTPSKLLRQYFEWKAYMEATYPGSDTSPEAFQRVMDQLALETAA